MNPFIEFWPYIVAYFIVGILFMCIVQYIKGRKDNISISTEVELEMMASLGVVVWPLMIVFLIVIGIGMIVSKPFVALSNLSEKLGRSHRR